MKTSKTTQATDDSYLEIEQRIQTMIDDGLDSEARRELLLSIDKDHPEYWRYTALGFVERQIIHDALSDKDKAGNIISLTEADRETQRKTYPARQWAIAACLALSLVAGGWLIGDYSKITPANTSTVASNTTADPSVPSTLSIQSALGDGGTPFEVDVSVLDVGEDETLAINQLNASISSLHKAQEILRKRGYDTSINTQFLTANLQDGRQLIVPVNHIIFEQTSK